MSKTYKEIVKELQGLDYRELCKAIFYYARADNIEDGLNEKQADEVLDEIYDFFISRDLGEFVDERLLNEMDNLIDKKAQESIIKKIEKYYDDNVDSFHPNFSKTFNVELSDKQIKLTPTSQAFFGGSTNYYANVIKEAFESVMNTEYSIQYERTSGRLKEISIKKIFKEENEEKQNNTKSQVEFENLQLIKNPCFKADDCYRESRNLDAETRIYAFIEGKVKDGDDGIFQTHCLEVSLESTNSFDFLGFVSLIENKFERDDNSIYLNDSNTLKSWNINIKASYLDDETILIKELDGICEEAKEILQIKENLQQEQDSTNQHNQTRRHK